MKLIIAAFTFLLNIPAFSQSYISATVALSTKMDDNTTTLPVPSSAVIGVNDDTHEFTASVELFPIIPGRDSEDSLAQQRKPLQLKLQGQFPVNNLNFLTVADNGKMYTMPVTCYINDSTTSFPLQFGLIIRKDPSDNVYATLPHYNPRIMFEFFINPVSFGLDLPPFSARRLILISATNAVINKL